MAQNFTIVRPADGSKVREKVHILIPKGSIPSGGYVGVFLGGKFIEATVPPLNGKYHDYVLDTKARKIEDSEPGKPLKLELVLYVDFGDTPRIVDRSSVDVYVGNKANIPVPAEGIKLRYGFKPGKEAIYSVEQRFSVSTLSESQNKAGGRAAELPLDSEKVRILYAVDNAYSNGDGLVRIQPLPDKGKDFAVLSTSLNENRQIYYESSMAPIYMRLTNTGRQVFGSVPFYSAPQGTSGQADPNNLYAAFPLPTLPEKAVRPGDSWASRFLRGNLDLAKIHEVNTIVNTFPARGEFVGLEWESGRPCARIRNVIAVGQASEEGKKLSASGASFGDEKVQLEENIWFALDTKQVVKIIRETTIETKSEAGISLGFGSSASGGGTTPGGFGPQAGAPQGGAPGGRGGGRGPLGGPGGAGADDKSIAPSTIKVQGASGGRRGGPGQQPQGFGPNGPNFGPNGPAGRGFPGNQGASAQQQDVFLRIRIQEIYILEK